MLSDMISLFLSFFFWELMVEVVHIAFMILKFKVSLRVVRSRMDYSAAAVPYHVIVSTQGLRQVLYLNPFLGESCGAYGRAVN